MFTAGFQFLLLTLVFTPADTTGDFMDSPGISFIEINVSQTEKNALQANPRAYVRAQMAEKQLIGYRTTICKISFCLQWDSSMNVSAKLKPRILHVSVLLKFAVCWDR